MSRGYKVLEVNVEEVKQLMNEAKTKEEFRRYQSIYLRVSEKMPTSLIAKVTGLSESHVHRTHSQCRKKGLKALCSRKKGGRYRSYLTQEQEREMLKKIEQNAVNGGIVEISKVHKIFEETVGSKIARYTAYRLLHRHGWRKIAPRPYHPKQKKDAVETFKKSGLIWLKKQEYQQQLKARN
ncbi:MULTISPECIES: helix-turn-helix domain-containing protein [unclassified Candidatus Tisiphia]|jgi:transposase|uniref:helix-turn-helix domain-containing protein n=2 Tax=Candidatus Tisiphia TaxID=2996317 RepID=UPI003CCB2949